MISKQSLPLAVLAATAVLIFPAPAFAVDTHHREAGATTRLVLNQGNKWPTDEPLRKNMLEIRNAISGRQAGIQRGTLTAADAKALGVLIEARVASIVTECKLDRAADANLHLIVADLIAAADALQGKVKTTTPAKGALQAMQAVVNYARYFDHPGWKPLE